MSTGRIKIFVDSSHSHATEINTSTQLSLADQETLYCHSYPKKTYTINPTTSEKLNDEKIELFLSHACHEKETNKEHYLGVEEPYKDIPLNDLNNETNIYDVKLTHALIRRPSKKKGVFHYDILDDYSFENAYTEGSFGRALNINERLTLSKELQRKDKKMIYKIMRIEINGKTEKQIAKAFNRMAQKAQHEYDMTPKSLNMKPPFFIDNICFLRMARAPGKNLQEVLDNDRNGTSPLTLEQRFSLSLELLKTLKALHAENRVHRDIKPGNIMVDYCKVSNAWTITIIDFGLAKKTSDSDIGDSDVGTLEFQSPESYFNQGTTEKSDLYGMGGVIGEVFGCCRCQNCIPLKTIEQTKHYSNISLENFLKISDKQNIFVEDEMFNFIDQITHYDENNDVDPAAKRLNVDEAIQEFEKIIHLNKRLAKPTTPETRLSCSGTIFNTTSFTGKTIATEEQNRYTNKNA